MFYFLSTKCVTRFAHILCIFDHTHASDPTHASALFAGGTILSDSRVVASCADTRRRIRLEAEGDGDGGQQQQCRHDGRGNGNGNGARVMECSWADGLLTNVTCGSTVCGVLSFCAIGILKTIVFKHLVSHQWYFFSE